MRLQVANASLELDITLHKVFYYYITDRGQIKMIINFKICGPFYLDTRFAFKIPLVICKGIRNYTLSQFTSAGGFKELPLA